MPGFSVEPPCSVLTPDVVSGGGVAAVIADGEIEADIVPDLDPDAVIFSTVFSTCATCLLTSASTTFSRGSVTSSSLTPVRSKIFTCGLYFGSGQIAEILPA